jgi:hypothetical protein
VVVRPVALPLVYRLLAAARKYAGAPAALPQHECPLHAVVLRHVRLASVAAHRPADPASVVVLRPARLALVVLPRLALHV